MIKKLIYILSIFVSAVGSAQMPTSEISIDTQIFPKEKVSLINNSKLLLAGELLEYKAYVQNSANTDSKLSKIVYVSMRNQNDSIIFSHKLNVKNGAANGDFFIPATLKTGVYNLISYTNFSRNNVNNAFAQQSIYIINTFQKAPILNKNSDSIEVKAIAEKSINQDRSEVDTGIISISSDKSNYGTREKVTLNIDNIIANKGGNYVLSVRKVDPISISNKQLAVGNFRGKGDFYLPELRGEIISGTVKSKTDKNEAANKVVALTIPGKTPIFKLAKTNKYGRFIFSISELYDAEDGIIQINEPDKDNYNLTIDKEEFSISEKNKIALKLDSSIGKWLQKRSVQLQVDNAYFSIKKDSLLARKPSEPFYDNLGMNYILDDYTRFPTVRETFVEVIQTAAIRNFGNEHRFLVFNEYNPNGSAKFNNLDPLVVVDGVLLQDNEALLNYSANEIYSIRVIPEAYRYGPKVYSGVIAVTTKKHDFEPNLKESYIQKFKIEPTFQDKIYYEPDYSEKKKLSRIPDYRVQLFWEPNVYITDENYSTSFYTSDVSGLFEVSVEGYTNEGSFVSAKNYFEVLNN